MAYNMCCNLRLVSRVDHNHTYCNYVYAIIGSEYAYGLLISGLLSSCLMVVVVVLLFFLLLRWRGYVSVCSFAVTGSVASFWFCNNEAMYCMFCRTCICDNRLYSLSCRVGFFTYCGMRKSIRCVSHGL
jgi:hypothetical protein